MFLTASLNDHEGKLSSKSRHACIVLYSSTCQQSDKEANFPEFQRRTNLKICSYFLSTQWLVVLVIVGLFL